MKTTNGSMIPPYSCFLNKSRKTSSAELNISEDKFCFSDILFFYPIKENYTTFNSHSKRIILPNLLIEFYSLSFKKRAKMIKF